MKLKNEDAQCSQDGHTFAMTILATLILRYSVTCVSLMAFAVRYIMNCEAGAIEIIIRDEEFSMEDFSMKPEFLYHGSQRELKIIKPRNDRNGNESPAVYAVEYENLDMLISFALPIRPYPDNDDGNKAFNLFRDDNNNFVTNIISGSINPRGVGFIYKILSEDFENIDSWQWISTSETPIVESIEIKVEHYWHLIEFSDEALQANKLLYPSDLLYKNKFPYSE